MRDNINGTTHRFFSVLTSTISDPLVGNGLKAGRGGVFSDFLKKETPASETNGKLFWNGLIGKW